MNSLQTLFNRVHTEHTVIEITATEPDGILILFDGSTYNSYEELPHDAQISIEKVLVKYPNAFAIVQQAGYSGVEAINRILRCLFGSFDSMPDIDCTKGESNIEYPSYCTKCEYAHQFCIRKIGELSKGETEVALSIASGKTDKEIANAKGRSENTVRNQRKSIERKLRFITGKLVNSAVITNYIHQYGG